jgi:hypothetical protein
MPFSVFRISALPPAGASSSFPFSSSPAIRPYTIIS